MVIRAPGPGAMLAIFLGLCIASVFGYRWYTTPVPPQIHLDGVQDEVAQAVENALQNVREAPRSGAAWGKLAMVLHANGFDERVEECYRHAEQFEPTNPHWPYLLGLHVLEGDRQQAIRLFRKALTRASLSEDRAAILFRLIQVLIEDHELDEASVHLEAFREIEPYDPRGRFGFGLLAFARGDRTAARDHFRTLTESPFARRQVAALLATLVPEDKQAAREYLDLSVRLPHDEPWPDPIEKLELACRVDRMSRITPYWELKKQGRDEEALQFLQTYVEQRPDAEVCLILGSLLYKRNRLDEAERAYRESLRLDSSNAQAHQFLGEVLCHKAEKLYEAPGTRVKAAEFYREVVAAEDRALARESSLGLAHLTRGRALNRLGRTAEAIRAFRAALLYLPELADAHVALGEILAEQGEFNEALEHLQHAVQLAAPGDSRPRDIYGKWQARSKK